MIRTSTNHVNDIIVDTTHINRIYADGDIIHGVTPPTPPPPVVTTPLVISRAVRYMFLPGFGIYAGRDNKVTRIEVLANMSSILMGGNGRYYTTTNPEPWWRADGWGHWIETGYHSMKPLGEQWFQQFTRVSDYSNRVYWYVGDAFGNFEIYEGNTTDTAPTGQPVAAFDYKHQVDERYQYCSGDWGLLFFSGGMEANSEHLTDTTIYRINIHDADVAYTGDYVPIEDDGTPYFVNTTTQQRYEVITPS